MTAHSDARRRSGASHESLRIGLLAVIALAAGAWFLRATFSVTMPLAFGFVLALLLYPVQREVSSRVPGHMSWLGPLAAMLTLAVVLCAVAGFVWFSAGKAFEDTPSMEKLYSEVRELSSRTGVSLPPFTVASSSPPEPGASQDLSGEQTSSTGSPVASLPEKVASAVLSVFSSIWQFLAIASLVLFFTLLMLTESGRWRGRLAEVFGSQGQYALDAADMTARKVRQYLWVRTIVSSISGVLAGVLFVTVGVDLWYLWAFLYFGLNYIPFIGSMIAAIPPVLLAWSSGGATAGMIALAGVVAIEAVVGNFLDPKLQGEKLAVSPVVLLASLAFLTWAWSWPGSFLAVPLAAGLVVVFAHIAPLEPLALLLSGAEDMDELRRLTHLDRGPA